MKLCDIAIRDPYIYADEKEGEYYLYSSGVGQFGRGFCAYKSKDLENWSEPFVVFDASNFWAKDDYWAPEVHRYDGKYYLFGTFGTGGRKRTCQILVSDSPAGPFEVWSDAIAPEGWFALDATLYVKDAVPYAVFSHEWVQIDDGEMCYVKLTDDLSAAVGRPVKMFSASQSGWRFHPRGIRRTRRFI